MGLKWTQEQLDATLKSGGVRGIAAQFGTEVMLNDAGRRKATDRSDVTPGAAHPEKHAAEKKRSHLEVRLEQQIFSAGLPQPQTEWYAVDGRNWRLDFAWPDRKLGIEVQGYAHRIKGRFEADIEKRAILMLKGWKIMEVSGKSIKDGVAIEWVKRLLEG